MKPTLSADSFAQKLLFYGIGAGALSAAATGHAAVVEQSVGQSGNTFYFTLQNTTVSTTAPASGAYFDFSYGKNSAIANSSSSTTAGAANSNYGIAGQSRPGAAGATNYVLKLGVGTTIGSQAFTTGGTFNNYYVNSGGGLPSGAKAGDWKPGNQGFVGLKITDSNGQIDYGFADVTLNNLTGTNVFTFNGLAIDTSGAQITTFAIPEPGSTTALLVAGAAGAAALRARRRQAS